MALLWGAILDSLGYSTSRLLFPLLSFGRMRVERLEGEGSFLPLGFKRADGQIVCAVTTSSYIGLVPWLAGLLVLIAR